MPPTKQHLINAILAYYKTRAAYKAIVDIDAVDYLIYGLYEEYNVESSMQLFHILVRDPTQFAYLIYYCNHTGVAQLEVEDLLAELQHCVAHLPKSKRRFVNDDGLEEQVSTMSLYELRKLAGQCKMTVPLTTPRHELLNYILDTKC